MRWNTQRTTVTDYMILFGHDFNDESLINKALTHSSYANEHHVECNERMEFLGDSVLGLTVSEYIFKKYPHLPEGRLSKIRANAVCEATLAECAQKIGIGELLRLGKGEDASGGRVRPSVLSDAFESVIAAIYLDSGFESVRDWILPQLIKFIDNSAQVDNYNDFKTLFQEKTQSMGLGTPVYKVIAESGPAHDKVFTVRLTLGNFSVSAEGKSKKNAEMEAARLALQNIGDLT